MKYKNFSIIVPTFNGAKKISKALEGIKALEIPIEFKYEIIIVDNNSTDNVLEIVRSFNLDNLRIVKESKQGLLYARDRGMKESKFEIVFYIDDDIKVGKNWITSFMKIMNEKEDAGLISASLEFPKEYNVPDICIKYQEIFAIVPNLKGEKENFISSMPCIKKEAYYFLQEKGFKQRLVGRSSGESKYNGGEDIEFSLMLGFTPYKCYDNLETKGLHFLGEDRLNFENLKELKKASGYILSIIAPYRYIKKPIFTYISSYYFYLGRSALSLLYSNFIKDIEEREIFKTEKKILIKSLKEGKKDYQKLERFLRKNNFSLS